MNFHNFKLDIINITGLERDALHIYVGVAVFLFSLMITKPVIKQHLMRLHIALIMATIAAFTGEYLDLRLNYPVITTFHLKASIHDLINTCFWPYVLYALNRWTSIFQKNSLD